MEVNGSPCLSFEKWGKTAKESSALPHLLLLLTTTPCFLAGKNATLEPLVNDILGLKPDAGFAVQANRSVLFRPARQAESSKDGADTHLAATRGKRLAWHD